MARCIYTASFLPRQLPACMAITPTMNWAASLSWWVVLSAVDNENGVDGAGSVRLYNSTSGEQIGDAIVGETKLDMLFAYLVKSTDGDYYLLAQPVADKDGLEDSGRVRIVVPTASTPQ